MFIMSPAACRAYLDEKNMGKGNGMKKIVKSLPFRLVLGVAAGIVAGLLSNTQVMNIVVAVKYVLGQLINFCVPLIILGFIAPSITKLGSRASKILGFAVICAYTSSVLAALLSMGAGYGLIPHLAVSARTDGLRELPELVFQLDIPQIMSVMSALVFSILIGLAAAWTKAKRITELLDEFQKMVLLLVSRIIIPILPVFIALSFWELSFEGTITKQLPVFLKVVVIVIVGHFLWMAVLYVTAGIYSRIHPWRVLQNYGPVYLTAVGTMSSAATLAVALRCAKKAEPELRSDMVDFGIPLFANIHLCGSVLTEVFFVMTVSQILYGRVPDLGQMILFCFLLGIFAIGAPGVPGGTVMASLGLITGLLGFDPTGTALMLTIFALQDSFGTACNVTGDGALTMILTGYVRRHGMEEQKIRLEL